MHRAWAFTLVLIALYVQQAAAVHAQACVADPHGDLVCGEGKTAMRVVADTTSPSKEYAFAWRNEQGLRLGSDQPPSGVENLLVRISDGAVLAKLGGKYWATGEM